MPDIVAITMNPALDISTTTEAVVLTHKLRCATPRYDPGGGAINVVREARTLGVDALAVSPPAARPAEPSRSCSTGAAFRTAWSPLPARPA